MFKVGDVIVWRKSTGMVTYIEHTARVLGITPKGRPRVQTPDGVRVVRGVRHATPDEAARFDETQRVLQNFTDCEAAARRRTARVEAANRLRRELIRGTDEAIKEALIACLQLYTPSTDAGAP